MLKVALVALALSATAQSELVAPPPRAAEVALDQALIIEEMTADYPKVTVEDVSWLPCGMENAWYYRPTRSILLCLELNETPAPVFVAAHEAAHAVTIQLGVDFGPSRTAVEDAADEVAALKLIEMGRLDDVMGGARWFLAMHAAGEGARHSTHMQRAWSLLCLVAGAEGHNAYCSAYYASKRAFWESQLAPHRYPE